MPDHYYDPVGQCIYCGTTELPKGTSRFTDEHIIPFGMGGNLILQQASCKRCQILINSQIETPVLDHEWGFMRAKRGFPSRSQRRSAKSRDKRTHVTMTALDGSPLRIPREDHSAPVTMYLFGEARILCGMPRDTDDLRWSICVLASNEDEAAMIRKYPEWDKTHRLKARPHPFARLLAKIAHGYAIAEYGKSRLDAFTPLTTDIILGRSDDYFLTVGGSWDILPAVPDGNHITNIGLRFVGNSRALLIVEIRLFSQVATPAYHVVVGEISFENPAHVRVHEQHVLNGKIKEIPFTGG